jgi:hypothetical protein
MTDSIHQGKRYSIRDWLPWVGYGGGIAMVPVVFAVGCALSHPPANWDSSFFGRHLAVPLWVLAFCLCCGSPFFMRFTLPLQLLFALIGAGTFALAFVACVTIGFVLFPPLV